MFLGSFYDREQVEESISSFIGTESPRVLHFDLDLPDSSLTCIVIRRYRRILKKVEDVVPAIDESVLKYSELFCYMFEVHRKKLVKFFQPQLFIYGLPAGSCSNHGQPDVTDL